MVASAELGRRWGGAVRRVAICAAVGALAAVGLVAGATSAGAAGTSTQACTGGSSGSKTVTLTIRASGRNRTVVVHTPSGYTGKTPVPLVLNLHGSGSSATQQEAFSGMDAAADADGFIVAYPQGALKSGTGYDWNVPNVPLFGGKPVPARVGERQSRSSRRRSRPSSSATASTQLGSTRPGSRAVPG